MRRAILTAIVLLGLGAGATAQTVTTYTDVLVAGTRGIVGTTTGGSQPLRVVGLTSGTGGLLVVDASGDVYTAGTVNASTTFSSAVTTSSTFQANGTAALYGSTITLGNATTDTVTVTARLGSGLTWETDNTYDLGASGANRPRDLFLARNASVGGTLGVTGAATLSSTLGVTGVSTLTGLLNANGGLAVDTSAFTVADSTGNTLIGGTLDVRGTVTDGDSALTIGDDTTIGDSSYLSRATYTSQTTGWRISSDGGADFRYLFVDEMHAKSFIADLEQALAGGQIIAKSVAMVSQAFTCPTTSGTTTLWVRDLPSMPNAAAFQANDWVVLRTFSRAAGALTIGECVGQVTSYADGTSGNDGQQSWTFTRGNASCKGGMADSGTVAVDALALDFGASGAGYAEVTAVDGTYGANSPYYQVVTWTTCPVAANRSVRARWGNLSGAYGYSSSVYGFAAGDAAAANVTVDATNGVRLRSGTTDRLVINPSGDAYIELAPPNAEDPTTTRAITWTGVGTIGGALYTSVNNNARMKWTLSTASTESTGPFGGVIWLESTHSSANDGNGADHRAKLLLNAGANGTNNKSYALLYANDYIAIGRPSPDGQTLSPVPTIPSIQLWNSGIAAYDSSGNTLWYSESDGDFFIDTPTLAVKAADNRVGIGIAAPTTLLQVAGVTTLDAADGAADNVYVLNAINRETTAGRNFGAYILGGSNGSDYALFLRNIGLDDLFTVTGDGNAWVKGNMSFLSYTDRTPYFAGDALAAIRGIRGTAQGEIDHGSLPSFARRRVRQPNGQEHDERDLGGLMSVLTRAVQQLDAKVAALEAGR